MKVIRYAFNIGLVVLLLAFFAVDVLVQIRQILFLLCVTAFGLASLACLFGAICNTGMTSNLKQSHYPAKVEHHHHHYVYVQQQPQIRQQPEVKTVTTYKQLNS